MNSNNKPPSRLCGFPIPDQNEVDDCKEVPGRVEALPIPPGLIKEMQAYAKKLVRNSPGMKPQRVQKKVAEKFKITLT